MCESEIKAAMPEIIDSTAARTSFQDSQCYVTFLFSEWRNPVLWVMLSIRSLILISI